MNEYLSLASLTAFALAIYLIAFAFSTIRKNPANWGKPLAVLILLGLMLCVLVAVRDGYGFRSDAVIAFTGWQATLFSVLGISILLIGLIAVINRKFVSKSLFVSVFGLFVIKLIVMETIRLVSVVGEVL
jgi:hypothetical protein